jgi:hypothetical protein
MKLDNNQVLRNAISFPDGLSVISLSLDKQIGSTV